MCKSNAKALKFTHKGAQKESSRSNKDEKGIKPPLTLEVY